MILLRHNCAANLTHVSEMLRIVLILESKLELIYSDHYTEIDLLKDFESFFCSISDIKFLKTWLKLAYTNPFLEIYAMSHDTDTN